jgi:sugar lactone lactonase YvrE
MYAQEVVASGCSNDVRSPFVGVDGSLFVVLGAAGNVMRVRDDSRLVRAYSAGTMLSSAAFDVTRNLLYAADVANSAIVALRDRSSDTVVTEYEDRPLRGPHSLVCSRDGNVFFTDSGPRGATGLDSPRGSLFVVSSDAAGQQLLRPISHETLAFPTGLALSPNERCLYVAEMCQNRVLRYSQSPEGVFHPSVFYQFAGGESAYLTAAVSSSPSFG